MQSWILPPSLLQVPFLLVEGQQQPQTDYVVVDLDGSKHPLPLTTVFHKMQPIQATPYSFLQAVFGHEYPVRCLSCYLHWLCISFGSCLSFDIVNFLPFYLRQNYLLCILTSSTSCLFTCYSDLFLFFGSLLENVNRSTVGLLRRKSLHCKECYCLPLYLWQSDSIYFVLSFQWEMWIVWWLACLTRRRFLHLEIIACLFTCAGVICYISSFPFNGKCELFEGWPAGWGEDSCTWKECHCSWHLLFKRWGPRDQVLQRSSILSVSLAVPLL